MTDSKHDENDPAPLDDLDKETVQDLTPDDAGNVVGGAIKGVGAVGGNLGNEKWCSVTDKSVTTCVTCGWSPSPCPGYTSNLKCI